MAGDDVSIDGRCHFFFAARYTNRPALSIGDGTKIGHNCSFVIGDRITIGKHCRIAAGIRCLTSPGTRPIQSAVWQASRLILRMFVPLPLATTCGLAGNVIIYPGVSIGENSIVSHGSVVMSSVLPIPSWREIRRRQTHRSHDSPRLPFRTS